MKKLMWLAIMVGLGLLTGFVVESGSCRKPWPWQKQRCLEVEKAILGATVRITFHGYVEIENGYEMERINGTISHATVLDGRYLLTHNHFGIPLSQLLVYARHAHHSFTGVSVYRPDGTALLNHAPLAAFSVAAAKGETILLDFGLVNGEGFFSAAGVPSAPAAGRAELILTAGTEVALVDWDGNGNTEVIWAHIQTVYEDNGLPLMQVDHFIELGASGGGVFQDGRHIGNNWGRITETNRRTGEVSQALSLVALNSSSVAAGALPTLAASVR